MKLKKKNIISPHLNEDLLTIIDIIINILSNTWPIIYIVIPTLNPFFSSPGLLEILHGRYDRYLSFHSDLLEYVKRKSRKKMSSLSYSFFFTCDLVSS